MHTVTPGALLINCLIPASVFPVPRAHPQEPPRSQPLPQRQFRLPVRPASQTAEFGGGEIATSESQNLPNPSPSPAPLGGSLGMLALPKGPAPLPTSPSVPCLLRAFAGK